jgi:hypothetical protein
MTREEAYFNAGNMQIDLYDGMLINRLIEHLLDEVGRLEAIIGRQQKQIEALVK